MPEPEDAIAWQFRTLIDGWILYGLPILLVVVAVAVLARSRSNPGASASRESVRTVRLIGLIHCALAIQSMIFLVQELLTMRTMGIPESHISLTIGSVTTVMNGFLALGLMRFSSIARRVALAWYAFLSLLSLVAVVWLYYYQVRIEPLRWPELLASKVLPVFLLTVMLLPRIKRVFAKGASVATRIAEPGSLVDASVVRSRMGWRITSLATLLFLIVVCSNLLVDAVDWGYRLAVASDSLS